MKTAALYLRSSKDRSDVSIDAQRRELRSLAKNRGLLIVKEYADVVESGKDDDRPGFQRMLVDMRSASREWDTVLMLDTSRLARRRHISILFEEVEAKKHGVSVVYKSLPESDPITEMLLKSLLQAMDEWHSMISKKKGMAGMAENVLKGYRAGGRPPKGYKLRHIETGAVRDGEPVLKSKLEPDVTASIVSRYLKGRAAGQSRHELIRLLDLEIPETTLISMEWNALTYAGHTVWNVHNEFSRGKGYSGKQKRRDRSEWVIQKNTHHPLITEAEAEAIIERLEKSSRSGPRKTPSTYLLSGLLKTPAGEQWQGDGAKYYRVNGRRARKDIVEQAVIGQIAADLRSKDFIGRLTSETKLRYAMQSKDPAVALRKELIALNGKISRQMDLAGDLADPAPALRKIDELERQRKSLVSEVDRIEREYAAQAALSKINDEQVALLLNEVIERLEGTQDHVQTKDILGSLVEKIELDPNTGDCRISYCYSYGNKVASPRGYETVPAYRTDTYLRICRLVAAH